MYVMSQMLFYYFSSTKIERFSLYVYHCWLVNKYIQTYFWQLLTVVLYYSKWQLLFVLLNSACILDLMCIWVVILNLLAAMSLYLQLLKPL